MPRRRSSAQRSGSMPVSARTSVDLPWSTWPAVATTCISRAVPAQRRARPSRDERVVVGRSTQRRSSRQPAALDPADDRRLAGRSGAAQRARAARPPSRAATTPGAPPPPTAPSLGTTSPPTAVGQRARQRRAQPRRVGGQVRATSGWPGRAASPRARRGSACRRAARGPAGAGAAARRASASPSTRPACGPPSSLSPLQVTTAAPAAQRGGGVRLVGQQRVRGEQPAADVGDHRHAERGELGDADARW